jgi:FKBP-type peptidyl-prolyl cis-trans isomerase (trigger factor)
LRAEYQKTAKDNLKLEFILDAIAKDQQIDAAH